VRLTTRLVSGAFSGALLVLSLPKPDLYFLSWIALLPLLVSLHGVAGRREAALVGYASGLAFFGGSCYWIVTTMNTYGGLPAPLSVAVFALFVGIFGLHHALFALAVHSCLARWGASGLWLVPAIWVAVEVLQTQSSVCRMISVPLACFPRTGGLSTARTATRWASDMRRASSF
jgi:apolipoprotein N-acyltransferase